MLTVVFQGFQHSLRKVVPNMISKGIKVDLIFKDIR